MVALTKTNTIRYSHEQRRAQLLHSLAAPQVLLIACSTPEWPLTRARTKMFCHSSPKRENIKQGDKQAKLSKLCLSHSIVPQKFSLAIKNSGVWFVANVAVCFPLFFICVSSCCFCELLFVSMLPCLVPLYGHPVFPVSILSCSVFVLFASVICDSHRPHGNLFGCTPSHVDMCYFCASLHRCRPLGLRAVEDSVSVSGLATCPAHLCRCFLFFLCLVPSRICSLSRFLLCAFLGNSFSIILEGCASARPCRRRGLLLQIGTLVQLIQHHVCREELLGPRSIVIQPCGPLTHIIERLLLAGGMQECFHTKPALHGKEMSPGRNTRAEQNEGPENKPLAPPGLPVPKLRQLKVFVVDQAPFAEFWFDSGEESVLS